MKKVICKTAFETKEAETSYMDKLEHVKKYVMESPLSENQKKKWISLIERDFIIDNGIDIEEKIDLYEKGMLSQSIGCDQGISNLEYVKLQPFYEKYGAWFSNVITPRYMFVNFSRYFRRMYYHLLWRDNHRQAISIIDCPKEYGDGFDGVMNLLREKKYLMVMPTYYTGRRRHTLKYDSGEYFYDGKLSDREDCISQLKGLGYECVITDFISESKELKSLTGCGENSISLIVIKKPGKPPVITDAYVESFSKKGKYVTSVDIKTGKLNSEKIKSWKEISKTIEAMASLTPVFEILKFKIILIEDGFKIFEISSNPEMPAEINYSTELKQYLLYRQNLKNKPDEEYVRLKKEAEERDSKWKKVVDKNHRKGFRPYMAMLWDEELTADTEDPKTTEEEKSWAHQRGFFSYRIKELGLTNDNYEKYVSDYDYFWVNRINNSYQHWIEDKLATRYILEPFKDKLPKYYYYLIRINGVCKVETLQDLPKKYKADYKSIFKLAKKKGALAVKKSYGTRGEGFYKLTYSEGKYYLNGVITDINSFEALMEEHEGGYLITEFVDMHQYIKNMYAETVNTMRVIGVNRVNEDPLIRGVFFRIGHSKGGFTDNVNTDEGGITTSIDPETGIIKNPEFKNGNWYRKCEIHPDTGVSLSGQMPHWDIIVKKLKEICRYIPQLEYLGFDVVVTPESFKIIEINVFPDYLKFLVTDREIQKFIKEKVEAKKIKEGIYDE